MVCACADDVVSGVAQPNSGNLRRLTSGEVDLLKKKDANPEELKKDIVGQRYAKYDVMVDKTTGYLWMLRKDGTGEGEFLGLRLRGGNLTVVRIQPGLPKGPDMPKGPEIPEVP